MTKSFLPANGLLHDPDEAGADSWEGYLRCSCGCETFRVRHNGRPANALLRWWAANPIRPRSGEALVIEACCASCGESVTLHCSRRDDSGWLLPDHPQMEELSLPGIHDQRVRLYAWYCWDDEPEAADGRYLNSHSLFSLCAYSQEKSKAIHIFESNC